MGTIFRLRPNGADFQVLHHFTAEQGQPAQYRSVIPDYGSPRNAAGLAESGAWLVGSTSMQGPHDNGALYRIRKDGTGFQILHGFDDAASQDGKIAAGGLVTGPDGNIYGTTAAGGAHGDGTLFRIVTTRMDEPNGGFESLHAFKADVDGKTPFNLTLGHDGKLYGNTAGEWGGVYQGSVYAVDTGYVPPADPRSLRCSARRRTASTWANTPPWPGRPTMLRPARRAVPGKASGAATVRR